MPARSAVALVLLAAAIALAAGRAGGGGGHDGASSRAGGFGDRPPAVVRVVRVVDGDTIDVQAADGRRDVVRYIGVDTPESVKPGTPVQCFAKAASHENARLVAGREVRLELDAEHRDRYGRLLAYVRRDGLFVNQRLVAAGFARTLSIAPNDHFAKRFTVLQNRARAAGRGLWGVC